MNATAVGLSVDRSQYEELIAPGRGVKWALNDSEHAAQPTDLRLSGVPTRHHESIVQSLFTGAVVGATTVAGRPAVVPQITGLAHRTGARTFVVDPADALVPGLVLR